MPTLNQGNGQLEKGNPGAVEKKSYFSPASRKIGSILGIVGALGATSVVAQQATNNLLPKAAAIDVPAVPDVAPETVPTNAEVISILQNGKDKIKSKFSTFNDAVFAQIVGAISLDQVKPETLDALAGAFTAGSKEQKTILIFSKSIREKSVANKVPIGESEKDKKERLRREAEAQRIARLEPKLIQEFNDRAMNTGTWTTIKDDKNDGKIDIKKSGKTLIFSLGRGNNGRSDTQEAKVIDGWYELELDLSVTDKPSESIRIILWTKKPDGSNDRKELGTGKHQVYLTSTSKFGLPLDKIKKSVSLNGMTIKKVENGQIAQQGQ